MRGGFQKAAIAALLPVVLLLMLPGCALRGGTNRTSIAVDEQNTVTETIVGDRQEDDYTAEELQAYIDEQIVLYNQANGEKVSLESCEIEGGQVRIVMHYATVEDYSTFNQVPCFLGTIEQAGEAGYDVDQAFTDPSGEPAVRDTLQERAKEWKIFIISEPVSVRTPDKILYATDNVKVTGRTTAEVETVMLDNAQDAASAQQAGTAADAESTASSAENAASAESASASSEGTEAVVASSAESGAATPVPDQGGAGAEDASGISPFATIAERYAYIIYK